MDKGQQDAKVLQSQGKLIVRFGMTSLHYKQNDMVKIMDQVAKNKGWKVGKSWSDVMAKRVRTFLRHFTTIVGRTDVPKWAQKILNEVETDEGAEQEEGDEEDQLAPTEQDDEDEEGDEEEKPAGEDDEEPTCDEEEKPAEAHSTKKPAAESSKKPATQIHYTVTYAHELRAAVRSWHDGNKWREQRGAVFVAEGSDPSDPCMAVFPGGDKLVVGDLMVQEYNDIKKNAVGTNGKTKVTEWKGEHATTKEAYEILLVQNKRESKGIDKPFFSLRKNGHQLLATQIHQFKDEASALALLQALAEELCADKS